MAVRVQTFDQFKAELTAETTEANVYVADAANIEFNENLDISGKKVAIIGNQSNPATIVVTKQFTIDDDFVMKNLKLDFSGSTSNFVKFKEEQTETKKMEGVIFENIEAVKLQKPLFYSNCKGFLMNNFSIINSVIELAAAQKIVDFSKGSSAYNINIDKSTLYSSATSYTQTYTSQGGQKLTELDEDGIQTFNITNSTFYNLSKNTNFFSHRQNSQKWLTFVVKNNIFVDCGKSKQVIQGLNGGGTSTNPTFDVDSNVFNFDGADQSETEVSPNSNQPNKNNIAAVITFKDAAKGDFTQSNVKVGDPRWIK